MLSDTYKNHALDSILGDDHSTRFPATVYIALFSVAPTASTFGTELTGDTYARVAVTNDLANWPDAIGGIKENGAAVVFPTATAAWPTAVAWAVLDHITNATAANIIATDALTTPKTAQIGDTPTFAPGVLTLEAA